MKYFIIASLVLATVAAHRYGYAEIKNGKVVDTPEVQHAKAVHYAAIAKAGGYATGPDTGDSYAHGYSHNDHSDIKYDGKYGYHYPIIKNGVPVDTVAVQHARAAHFAALAKAPTGHYNEGKPSSYDNHYHDQKYDGKYGYHYPIIKNGVPVEPEAVQQERANHFAKVAAFVSGKKYAPAHASYDHHVPIIHNGVPVDTPEVKHAKAAHFASVAEAKARSYGNHDNGHYNEEHDSDEEDW